MKFYIEFNPCRECKELIREINENLPTEESSKKFLRHITYNHSEVGQAIIDEFPKEADKENFPWFQ
jgi:sulfur relay (sulfurtransferase) DsrC/TusE family protein